MPPPLTLTDQLIETLDAVVLVLRQHPTPTDDIDLVLASILAVHHAETVLERARKVRDLKEGA